MKKSVKNVITALVICLMALPVLTGCSGKNEGSDAGAKSSGVAKASKGKALKANPATDFEYDFNKDNETLYIKGYKGTSTTVVIPAEIEGMKVTRITYLSDSVETVVIPESIKEIPDYAFNGCGNLVSVVLPDTLEIIGYSAFAGCNSLTDINIPAGIKEIRSGAFVDSPLTNMTIPDSVQSIKFVFSSSNMRHFEGSQPPLLIRKRLQELGYTGSF